MFTPANLSSGTTRAGSGLRPHLLEIDAAMVEGRLVVNWGYSVQVHRRATVEQLSESFEKELRRFTRKRPSSVPKKGEDAALSDELLQLMRDHRVPGLAIARFGADGITACWSSGTRTAGSAEQVELDTVFQAGSMSKTVAALTALSLVADGTLQLDADIREALREWRPRRRVTLRHLLGHTSGFARSSPRWSHPGSTPPPRAELLAELREEAEPGTRFEYANSNYLVLEQLLADTTGEEYPRLARRHVLDPLGMRNSTVDAEPPPGRRLALGHLADGRPLPGGWRVGPEVAAGGLWTTAEDMAKVWTDVLRALSGHDAVVLRRAGARHMTTPFADSGYGLGVFVRRMGNRVVVGHAGDNPGFQCLAVCRTDTTTGSIVLANSDSADCLLSSCWPRLAGGDEEAWHA
jgi:CubicO group peptidase (beta-lactamase class C family)